MKFIDSRMQLLKQSGRLRQRKVIDSPQQTQLVCDGDSVLNFSSNDYLGLASSKPAIEALQESAKDYGFGSGASHLISGHQRPHDELEKALAKFTQREAALTFSSGYMANIAILQSLAQKGDVIIADKLNHASLIDGVKLSQADSLRYPHCDLKVLQKRLASSSKSSTNELSEISKPNSTNKFVVTDGVFSMDGDIAPLDEIVKLCQDYNATLIVDDAHGFGVLGESGRGSLEHFKLSQKQVPVLMGTLGKAVGGYGAFVAGEKKLIEYLIQTARSYIYTTALPAAIAQANLSNLNQLKDGFNLREKLSKNITYFRAQAKYHGLVVESSNTAIQPVLIGDNQTVIKIQEKLFKSGILVGAIRPPTVPENTARLRITLTATHNQQQIDTLIAALKKQTEVISHA
jgi:8-amino-7-oxononanoate synthase